jgi:hypothetical protein
MWSDPQDGEWTRGCQMLEGVGHAGCFRGQNVLEADR